MNGAVEAANKNIKKIIQKTIVTYKDWHEKLPYALFVGSITAEVSKGATSYPLIYGTAPMIPIKIEILALRVSVKTK
jgi:hypothetical protein